jgi:hypothetical protein
MEARFPAVFPSQYTSLLFLSVSWSRLHTHTSFGMIKGNLLGVTGIATNLGAKRQFKVKSRSESQLSLLSSTTIHRCLVLLNGYWSRRPCLPAPLVNGGVSRESSSICVGDVADKVSASKSFSLFDKPLHNIATTATESPPLSRSVRSWGCDEAALLRDIHMMVQ